MTGKPIPDTGTVVAASPSQPKRKRSVAVDFFRGLGLLMVYVDHILPNFWHAFTLQGVGLSDFAEIFVFLSGYVNAAIYERVLDSGPVRVIVPVLFRKTTCENAQALCGALGHHGRVFRAGGGICRRAEFLSTRARRTCSSAPLPNTLCGQWSFFTPHLRTRFFRCISFLFRFFR